VIIREAFSGFVTTQKFTRNTGQEYRDNSNEVYAEHTLPSPDTLGFTVLKVHRFKNGLTSGVACNESCS
jgi:hypothetical protein